MSSVLSSSWVYWNLVISLRARGAVKKLLTGPLHGLIRGKVFIVNKKEKATRGIWKSLELSGRQQTGHSQGAVREGILARDKKGGERGKEGNKRIERGEMGLGRGRKRGREKEGER